MPETEKLLILGETFRVSIDILLKDEMILSEVKEVHSCGTNVIQGKKQEIYEGILIKESIVDDTVIDFLNVHKIELWYAGGKPKYWTVLCEIGEKRGKLTYPLKDNVKLTNYCALIIRSLKNGMEIV